MKKYGLLSEIRRRRRWQQMGQQQQKYQNLFNRNFHAETPNNKWVTDQTRCTVSVYDPRSVWQQHCGLQDCDAANSESGTGYNPPGRTQRKEEGRRRVAAPQRPGVSVYFPSVLYALLLNDTFWIKQVDSPLKWEEVSFYRIRSMKWFQRQYLMALWAVLPLPLHRRNSTPMANMPSAGCGRMILYGSIIWAVFFTI